jgi:hypothetical protein
MTDTTEVEKLKARVEELEQQLVEERDEFGWDLKAAKESSDQTIRKLEGELKRLQSVGTSTSVKQPAEVGKPEDVKMLTRRALLAERRVAELQEELKRASQMTPPPAPKGDPLLRQRAEAAERERDDLRKEKRALERSVEEKKSSIERLKKDQEGARGFKRQLESVRKDLADREKELRNARDAVSGQGDLASALEEKETKIHELAQELNNLAVVEVERDSLFTEMEQLRADLQKQQSSQAEKESAQVAKLEADVERLKQELAQVQLASGQMVEQRERETARLKADLQEVSEKEATFAGQTDQIKREVTRLRHELVVTTRERDELVIQLRALREDQETGVYVMSEEVQGKSPTETIRDGTPLGADEPALPVGEAEELFPEDGFFLEEVTQKAKPTFAKGETRRAEVPPSPMNDSVSEGEPAVPAVSASGSVPGDETPGTKADLAPGAESASSEKMDEEGFAGVPEVDLEEPAPNLMSFADEELPEPTQDVRPERTVPNPSSKLPRVSRPKRKGGVIPKVVVFGILAGLIVGGAYHFFPKWFGLGTGDGEVIEATDSGARTDAAAVVAAAPADAREAAADATVPDAGAGEAAAAEDVEEPAGVRRETVEK